MKKIVVSLCFVISIVVCGGLVAQNNDTIVNKTTDSSDVQKWTNPIERFIGVWSLERTTLDDEGKEKKIHPGTFMVVHPNASYTIFVHCDLGAIITSQGNIIIESTDQYVEVISQHVNSSLIGISNRIDYKLDATCLHKSFWVEKDKDGGDFKRQLSETGKRGTMPDIIIEK